MPAAAGMACAGLTAVLADRFAEGATLSGLNPSGGGPGALLLLIAAAVGLSQPPLRTRSYSVARIGATLVGAAIAGGVFWAALAGVEAGAAIDIEPLATGIVGAYAVPQFVRDALRLQHEHANEPGDDSDPVRREGAAAGGASF